MGRIDLEGKKYNLISPEYTNQQEGLKGGF